MPRRITPTLNGRALAELRSSKGKTQAELAELAGLQRSVVVALEKGHRLLPREELDRLAGLMGYGPEKVEAQLLGLEVEPAAAADEAWVAPSPAARQMIDCAALSGARATLGTVRAVLTRKSVATWARQERTVAEELWESLRLHPAGERHARIDEDPVYHSWGLAQLLCAASEKAAAADAERTLALADLALHTAGRVHESELWRSRVQGYCWAFVGNARRVAGKLLLADQAFAEYERLWKEGKPADPGGILDEGRLLDMQASLRCAQRRFDDALELHERALSVTPPAKRGYILLNMSKLWEEQQNYKAALAVLAKATQLIDKQREPRNFLVLRFNVALNLCQLGHYSEADQLLSELRELAHRLGNQLDLVRLGWLTGWVTAGLGRTNEAIAVLDQVRREFIIRAIDYDMALVSLDLAVIYLEQGHTQKVKEIGREMRPIFRREQVHREALAALKLFCESADQETATADLARRLLSYLNRSRHHPDSPFES